MLFLPETRLSNPPKKGSLFVLMGEGMLEKHVGVQGPK